MKRWMKRGTIGMLILLSGCQSTMPIDDRHSIELVDKSDQNERNISEYMMELLTNEFGERNALLELDGMTVMCSPANESADGLSYHYDCISSFPTIKRTAIWLCKDLSCEIIKLEDHK